MEPQNRASAHNCQPRRRKFLRPVARPAPHIARPDATHAPERAAKHGLGPIAQPVGDLRHRRTPIAQYLLGEVHATDRKVLHQCLTGEENRVSEQLSLIFRNDCSLTPIDYAHLPLNDQFEAEAW